MNVLELIGRTPMVKARRLDRAAQFAMIAAGYVMKNAGKSGGLGSILGGGGTADQTSGDQPAGSGDLLGGIIGAAGKFLGR